MCEKQQDLPAAFIMFFFNPSYYSEVSEVPPVPGFSVPTPSLFGLAFACSLPTPVSSLRSCISLYFHLILSGLLKTSVSPPRDDTGNKKSHGTFLQTTVSSLLSCIARKISSGIK